MFPLKNLVALAKDRLSYSYEGDDLQYLKKIQEALEKDGYWQGLDIYAEMVEETAYAFSQLILLECEKHLIGYRDVFYASTMFRETLEQNSWKYSNYRTKNSPFGGKAKYNIHMAIICYCIYNLRVASFEDLKWESWESIQ